MVLRKLTSTALEAGCGELGIGGAESHVCYNLGLSYDLFEGRLLAAIEEVLWERGRKRGLRADDELVTIGTSRGSSFVSVVSQCRLGGSRSMQHREVRQ